MAEQLSTPQRLALLIGLVIGALLIPILINPAPSDAAGRSCAPIVRKGGGDFYKSRVSVLRGSTSCREARKILWNALPKDLISYPNGWECRPRALEGFYHNQKCLRKRGSPQQEVIQSSTPRICPNCTITRK